MLFRLLALAYLCKLVPIWGHLIFSSPCHIGQRSFLNDMSSPFENRSKTETVSGERHLLPFQALAFRGRETRQTRFETRIGLTNEQADLMADRPTDKISILECSFLRVTKARTVELCSTGPTQRENPPLRELIWNLNNYFLIFLYIGYKRILIYGSHEILWTEF